MIESLNIEPRRDMPRSDIEAAKRTYLLKDTVDPTFPASKHDIAEPMRIKDLSESEDPSGT